MKLANILKLAAAALGMKKELRIQFWNRSVCFL